MSHLRSILSLLLVVVIAMSVAACVGQLPDGNKASDSVNTQFTRTPVMSPVTPTLYERITKKIIPQPNGSRAEYVRMLKDIWAQGDEIKVYVVNDGSENVSCPNAEPDFYVYHLMENGTSIRVRGGGHYVSPMVSFIMPGQATSEFRFSTADMEPGRYRVALDCGGIYREFLIQ